jgi:hypothetical protein
MKDNFIKEFSAVYDLALRLRTEVVGANNHLVDVDILLFLSDHQKYIATFKQLKEAVADLERAVDRSKELITAQKFSYETER